MFNLKSFSKQTSTFLAIKNTFWLIGEKIFTMILVLVVSVFVARLLGAESFGLLSYLLAIISLLTPLSSLGLNAIITRELVNKKQSELIVMSTALSLRLLGGLLAVGILILCVCLGFFSRFANISWGLILLAITNIFVAFHVIDFWFQAKVQSKYVVKMRLISVLFVSVSKLLLVYFDASLSLFIWASAAESLIISLGFIVIYFLRNKTFKLSCVNWSYGIILLQQSKWLILSGIASVIYLKIDQVMLTEMVSAQENGVYAVASRISEVWYFFPIALVTSFFPSLLKIKTVNKEKYHQKLQQLCDCLFFGALLIAILVSFVSEWLIVFLYGMEFIEAGGILALHVWAGLFVFMRALVSKWLLAEELVFFSLVTHGVGAVFNIILNIWLIPLYQGQGAAIATVVSYALASYVVLFFHPSTLPMAKVMTKSLFPPSRILFSKVK